jgi:hypothetical protein
VFGDAALVLIEQLGPARPRFSIGALAIEAPAGMHAQLFVAFVVGRRRLEERLRIAAV